MKSTSDRTAIDPAAFGSLMDPAFLRQAVDDSQAFAHVQHPEGFHPFDWYLLRARVESLGAWIFHRATH